MKAVIMAGGEGSRLRPLTCDLPKPMVPVVNMPVMEQIINLLHREGITEIAVTSYYLPEVIEDYFGTGERWGVHLNYFLEEEPLGTAGSVHNAADFLDETFLVISGDAITDFNLHRGIRFHRERKADATLLLTREDIPLEYGVVMTDDHGEIIRFLEKPDWGQVFSDTINTGIYILEPSIFNLFERGVKYDFSKDLFPLMLSKGRDLYGMVLDGYWNDIGNLEEYYRTQFDFLAGRIRLPLPPCSVLQDRVWVEEGVFIDQGVELTGPLFIGRGSRIGRGVILENSVIGRNCILQSHASVKKSILWDNTNIGQHAELRGTVLANNVVVQERAAIFDQTAVGRFVTIGRGSRVRPGIKIWPEREVGDGVLVDRSIVWRNQLARNLFQNRGIVGEANLEVTPESVTRLAVAYGSLFNREDQLVVSSDSYRLSQALKRALVSGLQAAGIRVIDIGNTVTSVARYSIISLRASGGVHLRISYEDPGKSVLEFFNHEGVNISSADQKKIERKLLAADYNRALGNDFGDYSYAPEMNNNYLSGLLNQFELEAVRGNYFSLVVDYEHDNLGDLLPLFLKRLNCQLISTRNYSSSNLPLSLQNRLENSQLVGRIMAEQQADLGMIIDHNGEELCLVSQLGEVTGRTGYQVLISYLLLERGQKELYLPYNFPRVIEAMAEEYGAEILYTRLDPQVMMDQFYQQVRKGGVFPFYPYSDALAGLGLVLEKMALDNLSFDQLLAGLPEFYLNKAEVPCDWKNKGRVMRQLSEEAENRMELLEGVRFEHPQGWALIVPDNERPVFHIYAEGQDLESAESLTGFYLNRVSELIKGG